MLVLAASCNYIPFPCNLIPSRNSDFNIDPVERDDNRFEILRDTIISQKNYLNDNGLVLAQPSLTEQPIVCTLKAGENNCKPGTNNVFVKTTVSKEEANNQKIVITKKEIYTIEKVTNENVLVGVDTQQPTIVKVRKQTVIITKVEEQS